MALPANTGTLDEELSQVLPNNTGTWADVTTWAAWTTWTTEPVSTMTYVGPITDLVTVRGYCLKIITDAVGIVSYDVYTSNTGAFAGEETVTSIASGATGVASFTSRYFAVAVKVTQTTGLNVLNSFEVTTTDQTVSMDLNGIDTSTLSGTTSARTLVLPRSVSQIIDMQVTPRTVTAYNLDVYVTDYISCTTVIPRVVNKSIATPQISLIGLDNVPRDAVVDVFIRALPEQYMSGNNLLVR